MRSFKSDDRGKRICFNERSNVKTKPKIRERQLATNYGNIFCRGFKPAVHMGKTPLSSAANSLRLPPEKSMKRTLPKRSEGLDWRSYRSPLKGEIMENIDS